MESANGSLRSIFLPADYSNLTAGAAGAFFYTEPLPGGPPGTLRLQRYQLRERAVAPFLEGGVRSYSISADKKKLLYQGADGRKPLGRGGDGTSRESRRGTTERCATGNASRSAGRVGTDISRDVAYSA